MSVEQRAEGDFMVDTLGWLLRVTAIGPDTVEVRAAMKDGSFAFSQPFDTEAVEELGKACLAAVLVARSR